MIRIILVLRFWRDTKLIDGRTETYQINNEGDPQGKVVVRYAVSNDEARVEYENVSNRKLKGSLYRGSRHDMFHRTRLLLEDAGLDKRKMEELSLFYNKIKEYEHD